MGDHTRWEQRTGGESKTGQEVSEKEKKNDKNNET